MNLEEVHGHRTQSTGSELRGREDGYPSHKEKRIGGIGAGIGD